ncbi:ABC transporter [Subtercola sp. Z020]|uniref:ABC transporter ATP-binding protein n=1 Tax=Subtercola sp. Z020 TaxID=2080582 RepID=UPI000CE8619F|nr:ABC transporter ATP-binding protein [Subtercola sp. Z020]PPF77692.1 ABC transporter [Subtercola sp. Z020]
MTTLAPPAPTDHILCRDLVRVFSTRGVEVQALQGLNLQVTAGEMVAIVGASGSGKSTLLNVLSGLDTPTAGSATVAGHDLLRMGSRERIAFQRRSVGFVWQQTAKNLLPYLTARENIAAAMVIARGTRARDRHRQVDALLDLLGISALGDRRPSELSGGQQQRTAIAVAIANEPKVLLADEPTGDLDEATTEEVLSALELVNRERGVTVLIVTHDPTVSGHVRRTIQIRDGRTSTELWRSTVQDAGGTEQVIAQEFAVLDRVGRLQLPKSFTETLRLSEMVRLELEQDHVGVWPGIPDPGPGAGPADTPASTPANAPAEGRRAARERTDDSTTPREGGER